MCYHMEIELRTFATFRDAVGRKEVELSYDDERTAVGTVLADLEAEYEGLDGQLLEGDEIRPQLSILKNGREVIHLEGTETELSDGDSLSIFPPVAGGAEGSERRVRSFRGISERLAVRYLENLGGERVDDGAVTGDDWRATLSAEKVGIGPSLSLTEVTVEFEGDPETLDSLIDRFAQKAMRAGG
jgi:molybdopterin synthase sulfur carrier subunit